MEGIDYWRLCDELSVIQAALLIVDEDPAVSQEYILGWDSQNRPRGFDAAFAALKNSIKSSSLAAIVRWDSYDSIEVCSSNFGDYDDCSKLVDTSNGAELYVKTVPNWHDTTIRVEDLRDWLKHRGLKSGFFFPQASDIPDYLDPNNANYAPKLAAAICAWETVTLDPSLIKATTAKQSMVKWLRQNAGRYGLTKEDGNPNEQGIEEIAKIANWDAKGGAPKTPNG